MNREHDLVALADVRAPVGIGDQIDGSGRVAREHNLIDAAGIEEAPRHLARVLVLLGRGVGEIVQPAVHVGVLEAIDVIHRLDDGARLLGGGRVVEVDERLAVDLAVENGKIGADALHVVGVPGGSARARCFAPDLFGVAARRCHHALFVDAASSQARASASKASRTSARSTFAIASPINDSISRARAAASGMPRERQ